MPDREDVTIYWCPGEEDALHAKPVGVTRGGWVVDLATAYVAGGQRLRALAARTPGGKGRLTVAIPADLAAGLHALHPEQKLANVLRTLVLLHAGRAITPAEPALAGLVVPVAVPRHFVRWGQGEEFERRVRRALRGRHGEQPAVDMKEVFIALDTVPALDRLRGDQPAAVFLSSMVAEADAQARARLAAAAAPVVELINPWRWSHFIRQWSAVGAWPAGTVCVEGVLTDAQRLEVVRRIQSPDFYILVIAKSTSWGATDADDLAARFHRDVVAAVRRGLVRARVRLAHVQMADGSLLSIAEVVPRPA